MKADIGAARVGNDTKLVIAEFRVGLLGFAGFIKKSGEKICLIARTALQPCPAVMVNWSLAHHQIFWKQSKTFKIAATCWLFPRFVLLEYFGLPPPI